MTQTTANYESFRAANTRIARKFVGECDRTGEPFRHVLSMDNATGDRVGVRITADTFRRMAFMAIDHGNAVKVVHEGRRVIVDFDA